MCLWKGLFVLNCLLPIVIRGRGRVVIAGGHDISDERYYFIDEEMKVDKKGGCALPDRSRRRVMGKYAGCGFKSEQVSL